MATSSITDHVVIDDPKQVEAFASAVESAVQHPLSVKKIGIRMVTDRAEFMRLMEKRRELYG